MKNIKNTERIEKIEKELKQTRKINHCLFALMIGPGNHYRGRHNSAGKADRDAGQKIHS